MKTILTTSAAMHITGLNFHQFKTSSGKSAVIEYSGRPFVCVEDNEKHIIPFWMSTGRGGKTHTPKGRWYPVVGMSLKWINKYDENAINSYYNSQKLRHIAEILNRFLVCLNSDGTMNVEFNYTIPSLEPEYAGDFLSLMNANSPHPCEDRGGDIKLAVNSFLESIGEKRYFD